MNKSHINIVRWALTILLLTLLVVSCWPKRIPSDDELIRIVDSQKQVFSRYVRLLTDHRITAHNNWARIRISVHSAGKRVYTNVDVNEIPSDNKIVEDFSEKLNIDLARVESFLDNNDAIPNEIAFYSYREGFAKGIAHIVAYDGLNVVDDLDLYGTKNDPRISSDITGRVYRKIEGNWFLFAM